MYSLAKIKDKSRGSQFLRSRSGVVETLQRETRSSLAASFDTAQGEKKVSSQEKIPPRGEVFSPGSSYLESLAKAYNGSGKIDQDSKCGDSVILGECDGGHQFFKVIYCGKEWCNNPKCVESTWKRRIARALPKVAVMEAAGYFILTIPEEMREEFKDKKKLAELRTGFKRKLQRLLGERVEKVIKKGKNKGKIRIVINLRAIVRFHWFGDSDLSKFHPHLNILVDALQKIPGEDLKELKRYYKELLERISGVSIGGKKIDLYYQYLKTKDRIIHAVKYIMRPTFLFYERDLAGKLKGFRNNVYWGEWRDQTYEEIEREAIRRESDTKIKPEVVLLSNKICPVCGKPIVWYKKIYSAAYTVIAEEIGQGYYRVKDDNFSDWFRDWDL